ncbi:MAG TPA: hypothetical protein VLE89_02275 [Chlamydiales bacterium]|nr:hypothetical protein [Chlamydiales bacterium]
MKRLLVLTILVLFCLGTGKGIYWARKGFSVRRVQPLERETVVAWNEEADRALDQKFHYLSRGRQCFAFASEDGKYVLKLPRTDIYEIPLWARALPVSLKREQICANRKRIETYLFSSFQISFEELKEQTGMIALHLGQTAPEGKQLTLVDRLGCAFHLPMEKTSFVLQHKYPILIRSFLSALEQGNRKEGERILEALVDVVVERGSKGILNRDGSFLRNYGYDGQKAYQIDIGSFFHNENLEEEEAFRKSIRDTMNPIRFWLGKTDPEMLQFLENKLASIR